MPAESFSLTTVMNWGPFVSWCYTKDPTFYAAFQPYLGMTTELKSNEAFYNAWHIICDSDLEVFEAAQCEYVYTQTLMPLSAGNDRILWL